MSGVRIPGVLWVKSTSCWALESVLHSLVGGDLAFDYTEYSFSRARDGGVIGV